MAIEKTPGNTVDPEGTTLNADGFVGVSPEYRNAANDTDLPLGEGDDVEDDEDEKDETPPVPPVVPTQKAPVKPVAKP